MPFIGIYINNLAGAQILNNHVSGYSIARCIQTSGSEIAFNDVSNCCVGAFIDPGIDGVQVIHNYIGSMNPKCTAQAALGVTVGVTVWGAFNSIVESNFIQNQHASGMAAGISVVDGFDVGPEFIATGNRVTNNTLFNNDVDMFVNTIGIGNVISHNQCFTPVALCD